MRSVFLVIGILIFPFFNCAQEPDSTQGIALVLSGGGASGMAHIGALKALEENGIKPDYITGTSAGALVGAYYVSGFSPEELETMARSEEFKRMSYGLVEDDYKYYFYENENAPEWVRIRMNIDSTIETSLPTNVIDSYSIDFSLMKNLTKANQVANSNFDSLFCQYRCVASDIVTKESVIFNSGSLNSSVRASMSYPFYLRPLSYEGKVLFDGGLYNNFPANVAWENFNPNVMIGVTVTQNGDPPTPGNLYSQIKGMIVRQSDFTLSAPNSILIQADPNNEIGTFDWNAVSEAIDAGYNYTMANMDSIKAMVGNRISSKENIEKERLEFRKKFRPIVFKRAEFEGVNEAQKKYLNRLLFKNRDSLTMDEVEKRFYQIALDEKIDFVFPSAVYDYEINGYVLHLTIVKQKNFKAEFGGVFSSRPFNTAYMGLEYQYLGSFAMKSRVNTFFGKFYGSVGASARFDFHSPGLFMVEPYYIKNRWDYFRSFATFFEDVRPSFLVHNEQMAGLRLGMPTGRKSRLFLNAYYGDIDLRYYQTEQFTNTDTTDLTSFYPIVAGLKYERSTLNRKQYPNRGTYLSFGAKVFDGDEITLPGSTSSDRDSVVNEHQWLNVRFNYQNFFLHKKKFTMGFNFEATHTTRAFFDNYSASILAAPTYAPIPESQTRFMSQFRTFQFAAGGVQLVYNTTRNIEFRLEGYVFQPVRQMLADSLNKAYLSDDYFAYRSYIGSLNGVYHSPLGPISVALNYYHNEEDRFSFLVKFGYVIFNRRALG